MVASVDTLYKSGHKNVASCLTPVFAKLETNHSVVRCSCRKYHGITFDISSNLSIDKTP